MPMLTTVRMRRPVAPGPRAVADLLGEVAHPVEHLVHVGRRRRGRRPRSTSPAGARRATCSTARSSVTLIGSPANIASRRAGDAGGRGDGQQGGEHGVVDALLGVVDAQVADRGAR